MKDYVIIGKVESMGIPDPVFKTCDKIHILNGHKKRCPACGKKLHELKLTFLQYSALDDASRQMLLTRIHDRLSDGADTPQAQ